LQGEFAEICKQKEIKQIMSAPHHPNQNPTEQYMGILMGKTRSLLFISGLDPHDHWDNALLHAVCLQNRTALPGRCTPFENKTGTKPDISHIRIFGCEALAYVEKEQRTKLDYKTEKCIYLGMSPKHSADKAPLPQKQPSHLSEKRFI
jgi:transposase InsO family protein